MRNPKEITVLECPNCEDIEMIAGGDGSTHTCPVCGWSETR